MDFLLFAFSKCFPCLPNLSSPHVTINKSSYKILRLLGEGGFSYVYLVSKGNSNANSSLYALKRIRCPFGGGGNDESFKMALKEIRNYHRFTNSKTPYIIQSIDESIIDELDGSKTIYILLPYFEYSLQDIINKNVLNSQNMKQDEVLRIFIGVCRGIQAMHKYKIFGSSTNIEDEEDALLLPPQIEGDDFTDEQQVGDIGEMLELVPFAHRDIKPANVMISLSDGLPVLVDLGSCSKARVLVKTRQQALTLTDYAQEHCTLPYRAPELLDVATGSEITELTDIWSLGCLLYACMYGFSPFEKLEMDQGANLNIAISQGKYITPKASESGYTEDLNDLVKKCLQLKSEDRPSIDQLIEEALQIQRS